MSILIGSMRKHLDGKKELTAHTDVVAIKTPERVAIPMMAGNSVNVNIFVKPGDKVLVGTVLGKREDNLIVPLFSSVSGTVVEVGKQHHSYLSDLQHVVIENDGKYEAVSIGEIDPIQATRQELVDYMMNAGIVGCGGAGFPAYVKYKFAKDVKVLIINAVECEPYITADARNIETHITDLLVGVRAMMKMAQCDRALIAVKKTKKALIALLEAATKDEAGISVRQVPDAYPMGWERTLVYEILKKHYDRLPGEVGAVVNNATTAIAFAQSMRGVPIAEKVVTISGEGVARPANVICRVGTSAHDIIEQLGGYSCEEVELIFGGPMMGKTNVGDHSVITPYTNAITVLKPVRHEAIACLRCGRCSDHCPAGILPVRINEAFKANDVERIARLDAMKCIQCGLCTYVCPSDIEVSDTVRLAKELLMKKGA